MDLGKDVSRRAKTQFGLDREGLVFASAYTFAKVMADNPNLARRFAERLLGIKIGALEFFEVEMDIPAALRKSVRMDAILAGSGEVVEIEMQSERDGSLERRLRYYQAMIDSRSLGKGQMYRDLPELYMLAICRYDHFGTNRALHRFEMRCEDGLSLGLDNGVHVIIANTSASMLDVPPEVRSLLQYVETNEPVEGDDLTMELADATREAYADEGWVGSIMTVDMMMRVKEAEAIERGEKEGLERGLKRGLEQGIERGVKQGIEQGIEQGIKQGIAQGIEQGEARSAALIAAMQRAGVSAEDILVAFMGDDREALYRQYGV